MSVEGGLLLVGYRVVPPWAVPESMADPLLPLQIPTMSDHLVDPVPDDDTWFSSAETTRVFTRSTVTTRLQVLAMGVHERDAEDVIKRRLTLDTDQLCLNEHVRMPWPARLPLLGYELIGIEACGFHSWLCYQGTPSWAHRMLGIRLNSHGLVDKPADARRLSEAAEEPGSGLPPIPWVAAAIALA
ncbi:hypothetical protein [Actinoallomurus vinaceus]